MRFTLAAVVLALGFMAACEVAEPQVDDTSDRRPLTAAEVEIAGAENAFGFNLFRELIRQKPDENVIVSPLSVSMALGMALNGARGATRDSMAASLEVAGLTQDEINRAYASLIDLLSGLDPEVSFEIANSIWYRQDFEVNPAFISTNQTHFDAEVEALDFESPNAPDRINSWVDRKTRGKIEDIVDSIDPLNMMFLINAIYFKGAWTNTFDPKATQEAPFSGQDGSVRQVPMMRRELRLPYVRGNGFSAVDLPYGDSLYSMMVLLPDEGGTVEAVTSQLTDTSWSRWVAGLQSTKVNLALPRFKAEYEETLNDALAALGMRLAFTPFEADFSGINPAPDLHISNVKHKSFIEVNEEGTEAAAATSVEMSVTSAPTDLVYFHVNRPFVFAIRENHTGAILFIGKVLSL